MNPDFKGKIIVVTGAGQGLYRTFMFRNLSARRSSARH